MHAGTCLIRAVAEVPWGSGDAHVQSTATRRPRPQAVRVRGASLLPFRFPARPSPGAPWARGLLSVFWKWGSPDLAACGLRPAAWLEEGPNTAHLHQHRPKTLARGQASRGGRHGASSGTASLGWLTRRRRDQGGVPHEVPMTQAMTTQGRQSGASRAVSPFTLWCKGSKRRREHQAKAPVSVQRDQDQSNGREEVIVEPKPASPPEPLVGEDQL